MPDGEIVELEGEAESPPGRERGRAMVVVFALSLAVMGVAIGRDGPEAVAPSRGLVAGHLPGTAHIFDSADMPPLGVPIPGAIVLPVRAASASARIYEALHASPFPSRFVLRDDGTFTLRHSNAGEYHGTYRTTNNLITFAWEGWSGPGPWGATALLEDDSLTVRFNLIMQMTDFVDDVYRRVR